MTADTTTGPKKLTHAFGDDWSALYLDGVLKEEGHDFYVEDIATLFIENRSIVEFERINVCMDWLAEAGAYPESLADVMNEDDEACENYGLDDEDD
jgi:hypothetical protein